MTMAMAMTTTTDSNGPEFLVLAGPTACGKSALALEVAERFGAEIVSADSCAVYRGMDIGAAKPSAADRARVRHHLVDIRNPDQPYSAGAFCADATRLAAEISSRGKIPLLVGGAMMWLRRLRDGLDDLPRSDAVREEIKREMKRRGARALHRELAERDGLAARRIHPHDRARIVRGLEVARLSGARKGGGGGMNGRMGGGMDGGTGGRVRMRAVVFFPRDRSVLRERIRVRLDGMFDSGFAEEVRGLVRDWGLDSDSIPLRSVGYRQVALWLRGGIESESECRRLAWHATCQLAKRQMTWLRRWPDAEAVDPFSAGMRGRIFEVAEDFRRGG